MIGPLEAARAALAAIEGGPEVAVVTRIDGEEAGRRLLVFLDGRTQGSLGDDALDTAARDLAARAFDSETPLRETASGAELLAEPHRAPERLIVVGAGHIAVPLAALGVSLGFRVIVLDDREEFATAERFAAEVEVVRADFEREPFAGVRITSRDYVALVTRGHRWDFDCLRRLLSVALRPRYIGMIGSRRRVRAAFQALLAAGVPRGDLVGIRAPIGLELGAETPVEIAVSIAAEIVAVRRGEETESIGTRERVLERLVADGDE